MFFWWKTKTALYILTQIGVWYVIWGDFVAESSTWVGWINILIEISMLSIFGVGYYM